MLKHNARATAPNADRDPTRPALPASRYAGKTGCPIIAAADVVSAPERSRPKRSAVNRAAWCSGVPALAALIRGGRHCTRVGAQKSPQFRPATAGATPQKRRDNRHMKAQLQQGQ